MPDPDPDPGAEGPGGLRSRAERAADRLLDAEGLVRVVSHHDADGLSSAGILARALARADVAFAVSIASRLTADVVERAAKGDPELVVFADMGSGDLELLAPVAERAIVLDHHSPDGEGDLAVHVNAHLGGADGSYEASAATVCFLVATALSEDNWELFPLALAGLVGDRQDRPDLSGLNAELAAEAGKRGVVEEETAPRLARDPLGEALATSTDPYLVGLSGDADAARRWLSDRGLDPEVGWPDLDPKDRRHLVSQLAARLLAQGAQPGYVRELVGPRFSFDFRGVDDAALLAALLNAAGRFDMPAEGLAFLLGDDDAREKLASTAGSYRDRILEAAGKAAERGAEVRDHVQVLEVDRGTLTGTIAGIAMNAFLDGSKATVAFHRDGEQVKVSTRGTRELVERGLDLAAACASAASAVGGSGGGHAIASGATVPAAELDAFLAELDATVGGQLEG